MSPRAAYGMLARTYPMATLFYHLQIHIESLFYKTEWYNKKANSNEQKNKDSDKKDSFSVSKQKWNEMNKRNESLGPNDSVSTSLRTFFYPSQPQYAYPMYNQRYNRYHDHIYVPPVNRNNSTFNRVCHYI